MQITFNYYGQMISVEFVKTKFFHNNRLCISAICGNSPFCLISSDLGRANTEYLGTTYSPTHCPRVLVNELIKRKLIKQISNIHFIFTDKFLNEYCQDGKTVVYNGSEALSDYTDDLSVYMEIKEKIS